MGMIKILLATSLMVVASFDGLRAKDAVQTLTFWILIDPVAHSVEHVTMYFNLFFPQSWVMESTEDVRHDFIDGNTGVLPSVENSSIT